MICRLCLKHIKDVIHIFDEIGIELNVAAVLAKYFWFEVCYPNNAVIIAILSIFVKWLFLAKE